MKGKKYEFTGETMEHDRVVLRRIRATRSFKGVKEGDIGGWIESEANLSHDGTCWVYGEAKVWDNALVCVHADVFGTSEVSGEATVYGFAEVFGDAYVSGRAKISGSSDVYGDARVCGDAKVHGFALVRGHATVSGNAEVYGNAEVCGHSRVSCYARVTGNATVCGNAEICGHAQVYGFAQVSGSAEITGDAQVGCNRDYTVFKNFWSSYRWFTYTRSNKMWKVGCFYGTGEELKRKSMEDGKLKCMFYSAHVDMIEGLERIDERKGGVR